ncbi:MAG: pimeloyl-CoA dehydrogenase large subunit, partial [Gammaproteobacteria bacterium]|nr:pimeloyl-CoA dehydrogenase large subunit [Gammaproteobacteria bacterium]
TKIWTTYAHHANRCFCLVRTDNDCKKQAGISFILIDDMSAAGVEIKPIVSIDGEHHLNQVFFDNVRVPKENLVGVEGQGWTIAKYLLTHERTTIAGVADSKLNLANIKRIARENEADGKALIDDEQTRLDIARAEINLTQLEFTNFRTLADTAAGRAPGPESSLLKIKGTDTQQELSELKVKMAGYYAFPWHSEGFVGPEDFAFATQTYNFLRASTIYGGSTEVQKNVVAKMLLGLR